MKYFRKRSHSTHSRTLSTLIHYFLSYFIILSFLLVSFFLLVHSQLSDLFLNELNKQTEQRLETLSERFNDILVSIDQINSSLSSNVNLVLSRHSNNSWAQCEAFQEINKYTVGNSYLECIVYYDRLNDNVITSGKYVEHHEDTFTIYDVEKSLDFSPENFSGIFSQLLYLSDDSSSYLIYYPYHDSKSTYTVFYILNRYEITKMLNEVISEEITAITLLSPDGQIAAGEANPLLESKLGSVTLTEDGKYPLDSRTSLKIYTRLHNNFSIAAILSNEFLLQQVKTAFSRTYLILFAVGLAGIFLVMLAMRSTYLPLHKLTKKILENPDPNQGYLEQIDDAFTSAYNENQLLQDKMEKYRLSMQKSILDSVIAKNPSASLKDFSNVDSLFSMETDNLIFALRIRLLPPPTQFPS